MTEDERRLSTLQIADLFNVPPHLLDGSKRHRTWRIRRWLRRLW